LLVGYVGETGRLYLEILQPKPRVDDHPNGATHDRVNGATFAWSFSASGQG